VPRHRIAVVAVAGLATVAALAPAGANAQTPTTAALRIGDGRGLSTVVCGAARPTKRVAIGTAVRATARAGSTRKARRARKGSRVAIDRCAAGTWVRVSAPRLGVRRRAKRFALPTGANGDYRVQLLNRRGKASNARYLRVGLGEMVDTPISFTVRNQNRSVIPCVNAPDGGIYTIKGTIVGPRAAIDGGDGATLYYHGLSYASFFWRFKGVPGYDYAAQQADRGHVSIVVDRLGYGESTGPGDANKICYSSQADIADQIIDKMRAGDYTTGDGTRVRFPRVAMVGHSAGAFLTEMTQYLFKSADHIALVGFNDSFPSPLVLATLTATSARCFGAADQQNGSSGARHYAYFGQTPEDFIRGHIYNADPAVVSRVLALRTRDPCGDIISIPPSFAANEGLIRSIDVPILLTAGDHDAFFPPAPGLDIQSMGYPQSREALVRVVPNAGHAVTLGRTHGVFLDIMDTWLRGWGY
jgi:pimeloyl-ACP methyl ester carboxylesterase